jgi:hypothetical protein
MGLVQTWLRVLPPENWLPLGKKLMLLEQTNAKGLTMF